MAAFLNKYHIGIEGSGYILARNRNGQPYYQKKKAPLFVNKFGSGDASYRDASFWQFWAQTNWRNGAKQLRLDDPGKFWKSENVNVNQLDGITLSKALTSIGQTAAGTKVNCLAPWRITQTWWNNNYGYRKQIAITSPSGQILPSGYPIKITEDTAALQTAGKVLANRNDWRIVYWNGSSWVDLSRDYIGTTETWFSLQAQIAAGASDNNYYAYYGYSGETTSKQPSTDAEWNATYGAPVKDANTQAIWHLKETLGTSFADTSGNSNTLTLTNGAIAAGKFGKGVRLTTNSDRLQASDSATLSPTGNITFRARVKWAALPGSGQGVAIFSKWDEQANQKSWLWSLANTAGQYSLNLRINGNSVDETLSVNISAPSVDTWYNYAVTWNASTKVLTVYINGVSQGTVTGTNTAIVDSTSAFLVGAYKDGSGGFPTSNATFDGVEISNNVQTSFLDDLVSSDPTVTQSSELTSTTVNSSAFEVYSGNSDGKIYKWDGTTTWTEQFDTRRIVWFETGTDLDRLIGDQAGTERAQAQSFQYGTAVKVRGLEVNLKKNAGTPTAITVRIETNNAGVPSGTLVDSNATATIPAFTTTTYGWLSVEFPASFSIAAATLYWIVLKIAAGANDNNYAWASKSTSGYADGNMANSADGGSTWTAAAAEDAYFRIKGESTQVNDLLISAVGGTRKMLIATGDISSQTQGNARIYSYDGTNWALEKTFATASFTEAQVTKLAEFNSKLYAGVGAQARIYEGTAPGTWTLSKDLEVPLNPGYIYAFKEYNGKLYAGGGSPEFLYNKYYGGFWYVFDTTTWTSLYPFDHTVIKAFEFYDAFLFGCTYHGQIYVFDTATLNPLFNFKDDFGFQVSILAAQMFDDKIYFLLYPQDGTNDTNVGLWVFDRHGLSQCNTVSGVTGFRCATVANNLLIIGSGDSGNVYKLDPDKYATQGSAQSSYFDANLPSINKLYSAVELQFDPLVTGQSIVVYYKFKESDSWTTLGTANTVGDTSKSLSFASGIVSKKITIKVELNSSNTAVTPKVKEIVLQYAILPAVKWLWTFRVLAKKSLQLLDKTAEARTATTIRSDLETAQSAQKLVTFVDVDGTSYNALFSEIDQASWVVNQDDVNEDEIAVSLLQA